MKSLLNKIPGFKDLPGDGLIMQVVSLVILIIVFFYLVKIVMKFFNKSEGFEDMDSDEEEDEDEEFDDSMYGGDLGFENENMAEDEGEMDYEMEGDVAPVSGDLIEGMSNKGSKKGAAASTTNLSDAFKKAFKLTST